MVCVRNTHTMLSQRDWIPMEWPAAWQDPTLLDRLAGTPVNCLVSSKPLPTAVADAAAQRGLASVTPSWKAWKEIDWKRSEPLYTVGEAFWPELARRASSDSAGPTGEPWLDANGWLVRLCKALSEPGAAIWINASLPEDASSISNNQAMLAVVEAWAYGGRRPLWIPNKLTSELAASGAVPAWQQMSALLAWQKKQQEWFSWRAVAPMLFLSDFAGPNESLASESLLLAARRGIACEPASVARFGPAQLADRKAAVFVDQGEPAPSVLAELKAFAGKGNLVITRTESAKALLPGATIDDTHPRYRIMTCGKGRVALPKAEIDDPWQLVSDAHLLMSRRWDTMRLFNAGSLQWFHVQSPDRKRSVVHLLNYSQRRQAHQVTLQSNLPVRAAKLHRFDEAQPKEAKVAQVDGRAEIPLPGIEIYLAVELEHA